MFQAAIIPILLLGFQHGSGGVELDPSGVSGFLTVHVVNQFGQPVKIETIRVERRAGTGAEFRPFDG